MQSMWYYYILGHAVNINKLKKESQIWEQAMGWTVQGLYPGPETHPISY